MAIYSFALAVVAVVGAPFWVARLVSRARYRAGLRDRLGIVPHAVREQVRAREVIWLHAVSVGEVIAATELIRELRRTLPEIVLAISTTTETGQAIARERFPDSPVFYLPFDFRYTVARSLRALKPRLLVLVESELWPRLLWSCARAGIPVAVVNARISDRSFRRAMYARALWRPILRRVTLFLTQGEETADRLQRLGVAAERTRVTGNLKYDVRSAPGTTMVEALRRRLPAAARVLVCGSTLAREEQLLLGAWPEILRRQPAAVLILAPRHPQRFEEVARMARDRGLPVLAASKFQQEQRSLQLGEVVLLDTIGDLAAVYSLGAAAFVGGSLVPAGGHNPLEPARFGVPVTMGPSVYNFREIVETMQAMDAIRTIFPDTLAQALAEVLRGGDDVRTVGERGRELFFAQAGTTARTVQALRMLLEQASRTEAP